MDIKERIRNELDRSPVVLFMKGTPDFPQCGFSAQTAGALRKLGVGFHSVNIFEDAELREALKQPKASPEDLLPLAERLLTCATEQFPPRAAEAHFLLGLTHARLADRSPPDRARDEHHAAFGYDVNAGLDINPWNKVSIELGARFLRSFNVPQQLGAGSVEISPSYIEAYRGVGFAFGWLHRQSN